MLLKQYMRLGYGVMVAQEILVLLVEVRILISQQRFGCKLVRIVGPQQRLKKTRVPGKDRQVSLIKNLLVRTRRYLISPIHTTESRGIKEQSSLSSLKFEI